MDDANALPKKKETDKMAKGPAAPDGGWGWIVCFACFMTHVLTDGTFFSLGIIFVELLDYYQEKKGQTAFIASLSFGVCLLSGPINAALSNYFGYKKTTIFGTLLMSVSLICSIFSPNVFYLYLTFGISGFGFGMVYLCSIVCVTSYFDKKRAFAVGLGVSGSGIGTFVFGLLTRALIDAYTWKGAILIQGGLMLNCVACGMVYLPIDHIVNRTRKRGSALLLNEPAGGVEMKSICLDNQSANLVDERGNLQTHDICGLNKHDDSYRKVDKAAIHDNYSKSKAEADGDDMESLGKDAKELSQSSHNEQAFAEEKHMTTSGKRRQTSDAIVALKRSCDFSVLKNIAYLLYILSTVFYSIGFYIPYVYLPDKAELSGLDSYLSASLISSIGITNTAGRIIFGFISDRKGINRLFLYNSALIICGVGTVICAFLDSYPALLAYTVVFGLFTGVTISLTSVIVADLVGIDKLAEAFGVMNFFAGLFTFLGPPIGGWLFDVTNSYNMPFIAAGVAITFSGAMLFVLPLIRSKSS